MHEPLPPRPVRPTVPINTVTNASASLAKMRVENAAGESVGTVVDVVTQADGKAIALTVDASDFSASAGGSAFKPGSSGSIRGGAYW